MIKIFQIFKSPLFYLLIILLVGFYVRLYHLNFPLADWHSWRQADTASVTRNFIKLGFNPMTPKYDDISGVADHPLPNPNQFRFVEFPIYNIFTYPLYLFFGVNIIYDRLVSIIFSLGSTILIYLIAKRYLGTFTGVIAAGTFALLPFNVFFSRTTLPEPTFVFFALGMIYFVDRWIWERKKWLFALGIIFSAIAFLMKPWAIFFALPLVYSALKKEGDWRKLYKYVLLFIGVLIPFILWRFWIMQHPEGIPASGWLFNGTNIRFRPAFFWWLISERMGREILGATGIVLFFIGSLLSPRLKTRQGELAPYFLHFWLLSAFLFMVVIATGNVQHNYYQIMFVPVAAIFLAKGFTDLLIGRKEFVPRMWTVLLALLFLPLSFYFTWTQVKGFYQINNGAIVAAGEKADKILPINARVIAPYNGDTAFLYQTNRPGFAFVPYSIVDMVNTFGVTSYVSVNYDDKTNWVLRHFKILDRNPQFIIADLTKIEKPLDKDPEP